MRTLRLVLLLSLVLGAGLMIFTDDVEMDGDRTEIRESPVDVSYDMSVAMDGETQSDARLRFVTNETYSEFGYGVRLSEGATVDSVSVPDGTASYTVENGVADLEADLNRASRGTLFRINQTFNATYESLSQSVQAVRVTAPASNDSRASLRVRTAGDVISATAQTSSAYSIEGNRTVVARGNGTIQLVIVFGNPAIETNNYAFINDGAGERFDESAFRNTSADYQITRDVLGYERAKMKVPVVIQTDEKFNSSGEIGREQAGIAYIPVSEANNGGSFHKTLAHETTHVLNNYITWGFPRWFEEGSAQYVEAVVADYHGTVYVEPFNEEQYYPEYCSYQRSDECLIYSSGTSPGDLYEYMRTNSTFMNEQIWADDSLFKYSFSDLFTRSVVVEGYDGTSLNPIYDELRRDSLRLRGQSGGSLAAEAVLSEMGRSEVRVCDQQLQQQDRELTERNIQTCIESYYDLPTFPESTGDNYTVVDPKVKFALAAEP
jgi:hypothetical protein